MKNYKISVSHPDDKTPMNFNDIFLLGDILSQKEMEMCSCIKEYDDSVDEKVSQIQDVKDGVQKVLQSDEVKDSFREYFHVDGAIKFNEEDLSELESTFVSFGEGDKVTRKDDAIFEAYMMHLVDDFTYFCSKELIFRNQKYYFLFPSLTVDKKGRFSSINDYVVTGTDIEVFARDFLEHYNIIDQNILLFSTYFNNSLWKWLAENLPAFSREISNLLTPKTLQKTRKRIAVMGNVWNKDIDDHYTEQWNHVIDGLEYFRDLVKNFSVHTSSHSLSHIIDFISTNTSLLQYAKVSLGIDIDAVFNKYSKVWIKKSMKKVLLGLLDAKINMLAFMQNATQIMHSEQFLNPEYEGSLVFNRDMVRNIKKVCPLEFSAFKELQGGLQKEKWEYPLIGMLDSYVGYFTDVLLEKNDISYAKITGDLPRNLPEITTGKTSMMREELEGGIQLLKSFFWLMDAYVSNWEAKMKQKIEGNSEKSRYAGLREMALNKLIRLYREENDPLVMIKTAQNALNVIIQKWFDPKKDILHLMGVNYGGTLAWLYAKYVFSNTVNRGQVLSNAGNIVYSIYDVQNANSFLELADYPFVEIMKIENIDDDVRKKISDRNWLLIFDDNTNSGETLDNLRLRAIESGFYGRIDVFACRSSRNIKNYKASLTDGEKLDFIIHSAISSRKSKVNPENRRYKELIGTIVGNRIHKILHSDN